MIDKDEFILSIHLPNYFTFYFPNLSLTFQAVSTLQPPVDALGNYLIFSFHGVAEALLFVLCVVI